MTTRLTALEHDGIGLVALGAPDEVGQLLANGRELDVENVAVLTHAGLFFVATWPEWTLREVEKA